MSVHDRLATITSIIRTRAQDTERAVVHGGHVRDLRARQESAEERIEKLVSRFATEADRLAEARTSTTTSLAYSRQVKVALGRYRRKAA